MPRASLPPFVALVAGAAGLLRQKALTVVAGVLFFGMLFGVGSAFLDRSIVRVERTLAGQAGMSIEEVRSEIQSEFIVLVESGSALPAGTGASGLVLTTETDVVDVFLQQVSSEQRRLEKGDTTVRKDQLLPSYLIMTGPAAFGVLIFDSCVLLLCVVFFGLLLVSGPAPVADILLRIPLVLLPAIGVGILLFLRSLLWVPFVGLPLALYFLPRLCLAPIIVFAGESGVFHSFSLSMHRTRGLWLTMFTRLLGGLLVLVMIGWFIVLIAGSVGLFSMKLGLLLWFCGFIFMIAFALAYLTIIAATVG